MVSKLDPNLLTDDNFYYFSMLSDRFEPLNKRWAEGLEKRFHKKFKPIFVLPSKHNKLFEEENYIVLNQALEKLEKRLGRNNITWLIYPEDLNKQFSENKLVKDLIKKLVKKQDKVFVLSFTDVWLNIDNPNVVLLGPDPKIAAKFDNKLEHIKTFETLGFKTNPTEVYKNFEELRTKRKEYPFFLSPVYTSGGIESKVIYTPEDLENFYASLRLINKRGSFIGSHLLTDIILAPNINAIVTGKNLTTIICLSDQILRDNKYMGNFYPSKASEKYQKIMFDCATKVGNYLSRQGFKGLFGLDFLITKRGECYPTDLNPRRQGGYYCNVLMSQKIDIIDLELRLALNEALPKIKYKDFQVNYCWAHSKLLPYFHNMEIEKEFEVGKPTDPFNKIGSQYKAIYYPKNNVLIEGNPGFYLITGTSYRSIKSKLVQNTEKLVSKGFSVYESL
ncbi:MAG TPA: ATP-grasp domain-containing protein [Patescibacteria group bacterium]|nr:ATP-grasp domain-containing protein [Patescibacteria group bacterium]